MFKNGKSLNKINNWNLLTIGVLVLINGLSGYLLFTSGKSGWGGVVIMFAILGVVLGTATYSAFLKYIIQPLRDTTNAITQLEYGDYNTVFASLGRGDEIGQLHKALKSLRDVLSNEAQYAKRIADGELHHEAEGSSRGRTPMERALRKIEQRLMNITTITGEIARGNPEVEFDTLDRNDEISRSLHRMVEVIKNRTLQFQEISEGNLKTEVEILSEKDILGQAIKRMVARLRETANVAREVANGNLNVEVKIHSDQDMMGQALVRMVRELREITETAKRISEGDLTVTIHPRSSQDAFRIALKEMVMFLRTQTEELSETIQILNSSSKEISTTISQISSAATETATAVTQTVTTIQEVRQTADLSSQKARFVTESAEKAVEVSRNGANSLDATIQGMKRIRDQMNAIAESIIHLSEQSQAIGEIIASVNDLAEQSNLLAVNASIEAAKAGEHGKGFAVVASEVKNLAEQSKQATAQVRTILNDIQKATSTAVMATEQGTKVVDEGVRLSNETSQAIILLEKTVQDSANAVRQISASINEQLVGVEQVNLAMDNVKQASEQNVDSMRQLEVAANNLQIVGENLKRLIEQYHIHLSGSPVETVGTVKSNGSGNPFSN